MNNTEKQIEELRRELVQMHEKGLAFNHPMMVKLSAKLDGLLNQYQGLQVLMVS